MKLLLKFKATQNTVIYQQSILICSCFHLYSVTILCRR